MIYPSVENIRKKLDLVDAYAKLKYEFGASGVEEALCDLEKALDEAIDTINRLENNATGIHAEPDDLEGIKMRRPLGPRRLMYAVNSEFRNRLEGALVSRLAGCTLGAPVEFHSVAHMKSWAAYTGDVFPPIDYWSMVTTPKDLRYEKTPFEAYTRGHIDQVPVDDDITYTLLNLMIMETYGLEFSTEDVAKAWQQYLPYACTAEDVALKNLAKGIEPVFVADHDNPYCQWIGAAIRSDAFAYAAPGYPEKAAELAYRDAYLSHRRNGIYGEMFFAAAQAAAFVVDEPIEAIRIGLTEIPSDCLLAIDIRWALEIGASVKDYQHARDLVEARFDTMSHAHTNNNACLTIFGLFLGGRDMTKVIGSIVAMGLDNDCTAATAGSIVGACIGKEMIEPHWYEPFNNTIDHYIKGEEPMKIDDVIGRFMALADQVHGS